MFKKAKEFWAKNKVAIITIGGVVVLGTVAYVIGTKNGEFKPIHFTFPRTTIPDIAKKKDANNQILKEFGAVFKDNFVPFATKEVAIKFLEERGNTYQIDILDDLTSVIWISRED